MSELAGSTERREKIKTYHRVEVGEALGEDVVLAESIDKHEQADDGYEHGGEGAAGGLATDEDAPAPAGSAPSGPASRRRAGRSTLSRSVDAAGLAFGGVS